MGARLSNEDTSFKASDVLAKKTNVGRSKSDVEVKQWEFFKKVEGLSSDYITKMFNLASTFFTPALTLPSKEALNDTLRATHLIAGIYTKAKQIAGFLDSTSGDKEKKKQYIHLVVKNATIEYKEVRVE
ncbi:hypothetical protein [Cetobacterium sp.]|uniref:hypothetical protein n=1 Tax=Cetobacterium sp. TaxID=2071632 RepID=UPI003F343138